MDTEITINALNTIIAEKLGYKYCNTIAVKVATIRNQHKPETFVLGVGSVLTITFGVSEKIKNKKMWLWQRFVDIW